MKALLLKDCYVLWKQMRIFVVLVLVFTAINNSFYSLFAVVWASMLPYTAIAYDERSHWDQYAAMMPYSTRDLVLSKYVLGWLCMTAAIALCLVCQFVLGIINHTSPDYASITTCLFIGIIAIDITLPLVLRLGVERGRMALMLVIFGVAILGGLVAEISFGDGGSFSLPLPLAVLIPAVSVVGTIISIPLSMKLYQSRS
ncbi:MAG: ABC-2 transporter permease [Oscillibacter sp.]|nr:ABC-2 transporter permease [Oscillibacter sp.]